MENILPQLLVELGSNSFMLPIGVSINIRHHHPVASRDVLRGLTKLLQNMVESKAKTFFLKEKSLECVELPLLQHPC